MQMRKLVLAIVGIPLCAGGQDVQSQEGPAPKPNDVQVRVLYDAAVAAGQAPAQTRPETEFGKYWIGLMCAPVGNALRFQLDLPDEIGLLVEEVTEESPAMKAGLQRYDVLLSTIAPGKPDEEARPLKTVSDLVERVQQAEASAFKISFLRRGRRQTLDVAPAERPKAPGNFAFVETQGEDGQILRLLAEMPVEAPISMRWAGPLVVHAAPPLPEGVSIDYQSSGQTERLVVKSGKETWTLAPSDLDQLPKHLRPVVRQHLAARQAMAAHNAAVAVASTGGGAFFYAHTSGTHLPDDVTLTIVRHGSDPAKISVKKGDQSWDLTENELFKLPEDLRPHVESALNGRSVHPHPLHVAQALPSPGWVAREPGTVPPSPRPTMAVNPPPKIEVRSVRSVTDTNQREMERQLKHLADQIEKLTQAVEKLQAK